LLSTVNYKTDPAGLRNPDKNAENPDNLRPFSSYSRRFMGLPKQVLKL